ncbi:MAG TPA: histidine phosphatase family protein [Symbiobacteriaceae bacterium]|jgi:broad specificity phosphatase PhoE|nr:histidine phosphatase family protein [Symbiobacteriaceae bacterium]
MAQLILIKHGMPELVPSVLPGQWHLSETGREQAKLLGARLAEYAPELLVSSDEVKAIETARLAAPALGLEPAVVPGLHEHPRVSTGFPAWSVIVDGVGRFYATPGEVVFGEESADAAYQRFANAVEGLLAAHPDRTIAVVAHGVVICNFIGRRAGVDPFALWSRLSTTGFCVLSLPDFRLEQVVERVS